MTLEEIAKATGHDKDTYLAAAAEIDSFLDYEEQSGRLDDRTREAFVIALEVLRGELIG